MKSFFNFYNNLPIDREYFTENYYPKGVATRFWKLPRWYISHCFVNLGLQDGLFFLWKALSFSILSKSIYEFSVENYTYCNDYINWRYNGDCELNFVFKDKLGFSVDTLFIDRDQILKKKYDEYLYLAIDESVVWACKFIEELNNECCISNLPCALVENITNTRFQEEFSENNASLSYYFKQKYLNALVEIC